MPPENSNAPGKEASQPSGERVEPDDADIVGDGDASPNGLAPGPGPLTTLDAALDYVRRGWSPVPIPHRSKNPGDSVGKGWQQLRIGVDDVPRYFNGKAQNIGVLLGEPAGGLCDIDLDCPEALALADSFLPESNAVFGRASTPRAHRLYRSPAIDRTQQYKDVDGSMLVEIRSTGGQTVFPPSTHPEGESIEWAIHGDPPLVDRPELVQSVERLAAAVILAKHWPERGSREAAAMALAGMVLRRGWSVATVEQFVECVARAACDEEVAKRVAAVAPTDRRIKAGEKATGSSRLAELVGDKVAKQAGKWIKAAGGASLLDQAGKSRIASDGTKRPNILVPGVHISPHGVIETSTDDFASTLLELLPAHRMYRRGTLPGELVGDPGALQFVALTSERARLLFDRLVRTCRWEKDEDTGEQRIQFVPCKRDHANLVLARAIDHANVSELRCLTRCPCFGGPEFERLKPGYNACCKVYVDVDPGIDKFEVIRDKAEIDAILHDLLFDFEFRAEVDWQNFIALLLTPVVRPAIEGNLPFYLVLAPIERTGKTKLVERVFGTVLQGRPISSMTLSTTEEEIEKRVTALLIAAQESVHLDNLPARLDSAVLSSLFTTTSYRGRILGKSQTVDLPNDVIWIGSGNNTHASGEVAKRIIPINLLPSTAHPEKRTNFRHKNLQAYLDSVRAKILGALHGMVLNWIDAGRPEGVQAFGGFEQFSSVVGGIMAVQGYDKWLSNREEWVGDADDQGADLGALVEAWSAKTKDWVRPGDVIEIAIAAELFPEIVGIEDRQKRATLFARRVLMPAAQRPVGKCRIEAKGTGSSRRYRVIPLPEVKP